MDENKYGEFVAKEVDPGLACSVCVFIEDPLKGEPCPQSQGGPGCLPTQRKDKRNIIWVREQ